MNAAAAVAPISLSTARLNSVHVFAQEPVVEATAAALAHLIDPMFLDEIGWDAQGVVLVLPAGHRLLGRPVCRVAGCTVTATHRSRICQCCRRRLSEHGMSDAQVEVLGARADPVRGVGGCLVRDCARQRVSSPQALCRSHCDQRHALGLSMPQFLADPRTTALTACEPCLVVACPRQRRHRDGTYCEAHQLRWRGIKGSDPQKSEDLWQRTEPPVAVGGQVSLRGLGQVAVAQVLFGLQQRCRQDGVKTKEADLRVICADLRRQQLRSVADYHPVGHRDQGFTALVNSLIINARRAFATPETEVLEDQWDLAVFGHSGTVSFTGITQLWLREAAKRWAADNLPRRRIRPGRRTSAGLAVRYYVNALARLSESIRVRPDHGQVPAALGRVDVEAFLNRLGYLASTGQISIDARIRAAREVRQVLTTIRTMGLTRPGALAAGLGDDFTIAAGDIPDQPEPAEAGRGLPLAIMGQICTHLDALTSRPMRTGIELAIDTGRRPEEICDLAWDCLARDSDGLAVLVFDNHKANRLGRRLPIGAETAVVITAQQKWVTDRYPRTPVADLKLLPTDRRNPHGTKAITAFSLSFHHRVWVSAMPMLRTADGVEFDKARVVLYAYRHTYAQRHADAGVPVDVLRELMDHRNLDTTSGYYQIGHRRRREAVDRVAALQFDRHGQRVWRHAQQLLDSEHARRSVGEVVVPFGVCAEPSNVPAGGHACPYRFRCVGCDHFRTDVSYLPDLQAYLDDLLRNRERLLATKDLEDWARDEALPSDEEITRIRRLICTVEAGLDQLTAAQRAQIEQDVALLRRHRTVALGTPRIRVPLSNIRTDHP